MNTDLVLSTDPPDAQMVDIVYHINLHVGLAEAFARDAVRHAIEAGVWLAKAKEITPHGQWASWVDRNVNLSMRTVQAYMRLASEFPRLDSESATRVAHLPLRDAMKAISAPADPPPRHAAIVYRVERIDERERIVRGIRKSTAYMRKSMRAIQHGQPLNQRDFTTLRKHVAGLLEEIDRIAAISHADELEAAA